MICCNSVGVQLPPVMEMKAKSRHTQRVNQTSDVAGFFSTSNHFPPLYQQLSQQRQPPTILSWNLIASVTLLKRRRRPGPWAQVELFLKIQQIFSCCTAMVSTHNSCQNSDLPTGTLQQILEESNILWEQPLPNWWQRTRQQVVHKVVVCSSRKIPGQLNTGVPRPVHLSSCISKEIPLHSTIKVASVSAHSTKNLARVGKVEHFSDVSAVADEAPPLILCIKVHIAGLVQLIAKKQKWCRID